MTTEELLNRVTRRLNKTWNPTLPPEETMHSILELRKEKGTLKKENDDLRNEISVLNDRIDFISSQKEEAEFNSKRANEKVKEQEWIAHELANFIIEVANGIYQGKEPAAARRVYDLNSGSIRKRRLKAYNFDSSEEAKSAYAEETGKEYNSEEFIEWIFRFA